MMFEAIMQYLVMAEAVVIAIIAGLFGLSQHRQKKANERKEKRQKENDARVEKRAEIRRQESLLSIRLMSANMGLAIATALAVQKNEVNGLMQRALDEASAAQEAYQEFLKSIAVDQMATD